MMNVCISAEQHIMKNAEYETMDYIFFVHFLDKLLPTCFMLGQIKEFIANYMQLVSSETRDD